MKEKNQKPKTIIKYVLLTITVMWTAFIFHNSLKTATESLEQTSVFVQLFTNLVKAIYGESIPTGIILYIKNGFIDDIRNIAHMFEFFMLYIFARMTVKLIDGIKRKVLLVFIYGFSIIFTDETIQIFVDGRDFQVHDIILDSIGLIIAALIILVVNNLVVKKRVEKSI